MTAPLAACPLNPRHSQVDHHRHKHDSIHANTWASCRACHHCQQGVPARHSLLPMMTMMMVRHPNSLSWPAWLCCAGGAV